MKHISRLFFACATIGMLSVHGYADMSTVLQSMVFPGMGQLNDGQTVKGLAFMGSEIALISLTAEFFGRSSAHARNTEYLQAKLNQPEITAMKRDSIMVEWQDSKDKNEQYQLFAYGFLGSAAALWVYNVFDSMLFSSSGSAFLRKQLKENVAVAFGPDNAGVAYKFSF